MSENRDQDDTGARRAYFTPDRDDILHVTRVLLAGLGDTATISFICKDAGWTTVTDHTMDVEQVEITTTRYCLTGPTSSTSTQDSPVDTLVIHVDHQPPIAFLHPTTPSADPDRF